MRTKLTIVGLAVLLAIPVSAQGKAERKRGRDMGAPNTQQIKATKSERFRRGINGLLARANQGLDLDEEQKTKVKAVADEFRERYVNEKTRSKNTLDTMDKLKEARESGDKERVKELRGQLKRLRGNNLSGEFFEAIRPIMREDQLDKLDRMQHPVKPAAQPTQNPTTKLLRIRDELGLSPQQNKMYNKAISRFRKPTKKTAEPDAEILSLVAELQEAVASGNEDRIAEIRERVREKSQSSSKIEALYAELATFLDDDQMERVEMVRESMQTHDSRDARAILRAVRRLRLDREQREKLREVDTYAREKLRSARRDEAAREELNETVNERVRAFLTELQIKQLDEILEKTAPSRTRARQPAKPKPTEEGAAEETEVPVEEDKP